MTMPFGYASPEQQVRDKSEYARKGIARGRSVVVLTYVDGILFVAENPSTTLHKISEMYDRIGFAAVGKYNEFENLRTAGIRIMDTRGYMYDRRDVTSRALANAYAQTLGAIFTESIKPYEVEIVVAEVGHTAADDQIFRLTYDGSIADERGFIAIGGQSEQVLTSLREHHTEGQPLATALRVAVDALTAGAPPGAQNGERTLTAGNLEVAMLDRKRSRRLFKRIVGSQLDGLLEETAPPAS
ncbi:proteasome subunit alpha [Frankia sp. Mgl5]|uniref:Proteasome subunit alpha n=1 Tax=Parafrankia soli TaxID=2599596 RepID=A0A1S1Q3S5_9ACTN|nr:MULTISPECIES: proteasome subunit alpha [Frankiaceae]CAI7974995.1 Proteasome subunit alpha [Frankia sp. Hr75.2]MCK9927786.1 proteasome subunit alpha [Frankia sp. Mgl5]OHV28219.1 proteasome subunit alpha [Parafrankia soli]TCJ33052.1 proteasome subunit alpha [Parafrankia sp. BMG5.11]SQD98964.1 Proteasome subunit alpha [Parafrankia sp. Ea1.12]